MIPLVCNGCRHRNDYEYPVGFGGEALSCCFCHNRVVTESQYEREPEPRVGPPTRADASLQRNLEAVCRNFDDLNQRMNDVPPGYYRKTLLGAPYKLVRLDK